jgi:hypothetical protein
MLVIRFDLASNFEDFVIGTFSCLVFIIKINIVSIDAQNSENFESL